MQLINQAELVMAELGLIADGHGEIEHVWFAYVFQITFVILLTVRF